MPPNPIRDSLPTRWALQKDALLTEPQAPASQVPSPVQSPPSEAAVCKRTSPISENTTALRSPNVQDPYSQQVLKAYRSSLFDDTHKAQSSRGGKAAGAGEGEGAGVQKWLLNYILKKNRTVLSVLNCSTKECRLC